jgi:hypothetical protein
MVEQALKRAVMADDGRTLRRGVEEQLRKFSEGDQAAAVWVRDTLDGKPKQAIDFNDDNNTLASLQVLFVEAAQRLADQRQGVLIEQSGTILPQAGDGREPDR